MTLPNALARTGNEKLLGALKRNDYATIRDILFNDYKYNNADQDVLQMIHGWVESGYVS